MRKVKTAAKKATKVEAVQATSAPVQKLGARRSLVRDAASIRQDDSNAAALTTRDEAYLAMYSKLANSARQVSLNALFALETNPYYDGSGKPTDKSVPKRLARLAQLEISKDGYTFTLTKEAMTVGRKVIAAYK